MAQERLWERAVEFVRTETIGASGTRDTSATSFRFYACLSAMTYVQTTLSAARYSYLFNHERARLTNASTLTSWLDIMAGICGAQAQTMHAILHALDVPVRFVQVFFTDNGVRANHIFLEAEWDGQWHMFDVSWGFFPEGPAPFDVLSLSDVRAGRPFSASINKSNPWYVAASRVYDVFGYLRADEFQVLLDGAGELSLTLFAPDALGHVYDMSNLPIAIGSVAQFEHVPPGATTFSLECERDAWLEIGIDRVNGHDSRLVIGSARSPASPGLCRFNVGPGRIAMTVEGTDPNSYAVVNWIALRHH